MNILKKLRKAAFKQTVILLILGLVFVVIGGFFTVMPDTPPTDLSELTADEIDSDRFVSLSSFVLVYSYATQENDGITYMYSGIGIEDKNGDRVLLSLRTTEEEGNRLFALLEADETITWFEDQFYYGTLETISGDAKDFFDEGRLIYANDPDVLVSYTVLDATPGVYDLDDSTNMIMGWVFIIMGLALTILPLLSLFGVTQRSVFKSASKLAVGGNARFYLEDFDTKAVEVNGVYLTDDAILFNQGYITRLLPISDLIWAFRKEVDQRLYFFIRIATYHFIILMTPDKKKHQLIFKKEAQMEAVMTALKEHCPELVVTQYDRQLEKIFKQDPSSFKAAVTEISQRLKAKAEQAQTESQSNVK